MNINSDINVLGSLPDWSLIKVFLQDDMFSIQKKGDNHQYSIKINKSGNRFEKSIKTMLIQWFSHLIIGLLILLVTRINKIFNI